MKRKTNHKILATLALVLICSIMLTSFGIGYAGGVRGVGLAGICFFLTFGILVALAQMIPAAILLASLVGTSVSMIRKREIPIRTA